MPDIQAFRGVRYDLGHVGSLSDVVAPPYDVIGPDLQDALYKQHPANVVRLILNREEPGDDEHNNRYTRAARFFRDWRSQGLLFSEPDPAVYVYHQEFDYEGRPYTRHGLLARVRLEPFGQGKIYPHEETMPGPKQDRLLLTRACRANLSPVFGIYPDEAGDAQKIADQAVQGKTPLVATDHLGVVHRFWPVSDVDVITKLTAALGPKPVFIADGHHRYETALTYRQELASQQPLDANHPANFVLMMLIGVKDPGLIVLPTHRLFRGLPPISSNELIERLGDAFTTRVAGEGSDLAATVWDEIENEGEQGTLGLFTAQDERWVVARITDEGRAKMAELTAEHSEAWRELGVAVLHRLVIESQLAATELPKPTYVHLIDEVVAELDTGEYNLAALVMPATLEHIEKLSRHFERMPAKSTYFYPKLLSGLVFNPLE